MWHTTVVLGKMPQKGYQSITIREEIYNGLELEAEKKHRSVANLTELILIEYGIKKLSEHELKRELEAIAQ